MSGHTAIDLSRGLSDAEAQALLAQDGFNELPSAGRRPHWKLIAEIIREPMFALLVGAAVLYATIGDLGEAAIPLAFASISVTIGSSSHPVALILRRCSRERW